MGKDLAIFNLQVSYIEIQIKFTYVIHGLYTINLYKHVWNICESKCFIGNFITEIE